MGKAVKNTGHKRPKQEIAFYTIDECFDFPPLEPLWGNWLFRKCVVLVAGDPGISKTTFFYAFLKAMVDNQPFLDTVPAQLNLSGLFLDLESCGSLVRARMTEMELPANYNNFWFTPHPECQLKTLEPHIDRLIETRGVGFDVVVVDCLREAFWMEDENDNVEGRDQMHYARVLAEKWNCALVLIHHSSKANMPGVRKASGASSRVALADVNINFDDLGPGFPTDIFIMEIPKNRMIDDRFRVFIKKENKQFFVCDPPTGFLVKQEAAIYEPTTNGYRIQHRVERLLMVSRPLAPTQIANELKCGVASVHRALGALIAIGKAEKVLYGRYTRNHRMEEEEEE